jgi:WhiB family redox-sensing transcriptional regulator
MAGGRCRRRARAWCRDGLGAMSPGPTPTVQLGCGLAASWVAYDTSRGPRRDGISGQSGPGFVGVSVAHRPPSASSRRAKGGDAMSKNDSLNRGGCRKEAAAAEDAGVACREATPAPTPAVLAQRIGGAGRRTASAKASTRTCSSSVAVTWRRVAVAKAVWVRCPVAGACLDAATARQERWGVWGGANEAERRRVLCQRRTVSAAA